MRDTHKILNGKVFKIDDKFWDTHYPPNGWGCRCTVRTLDKSQAKKTGISKREKIKKVQRINEKTGEVYQGIKGIDTGWDYNVGREDIYGKINAVYRDVDPVIGNMLLKKLVTNKAVLTGWIAQPTRQFLPVSKLPVDIKTALKSDNDLLMLSNDTLRKQIKKHTDLTTDDFGKIQDVLKSGTVIQGRGDSLDVIQNGYFLSIKKTKKDEILINSFHKIDVIKSDKKINKATGKNKVIR